MDLQQKLERRYKFTSSCIYKLLTLPQNKEERENGELGGVAKEYVMEKIAEEIDGYLPDFENEATRWGNENEPKAVYWYERLTRFTVSNPGFISVNDFFGGSPDRKVFDPSTGERGGLEVKCPHKTTNHLWHCMINSDEYFKKNHKDYYWQCVSHMITLDVEWCDFVSFDPRINYEIGFFRYRLYRNEADVLRLLERVEEANNYKNKIKIQLGLCLYL
jgi:hypothetical protein